MKSGLPSLHNKPQHKGWADNSVVRWLAVQSDSETSVISYKLGMVAHSCSPTVGGQKQADPGSSQTIGLVETVSGSVTHLVSKPNKMVEQYRKAPTILHTHTHDECVPHL